MKLPRWRLFPKYATLIIAVVAGVLLISGAINLVFSWREVRSHLVALQMEKAQGAATRIEQYVLDIEHQLGWTAFPRTDASTDATEQRRIEYLKLLRQVPAITELVWIGADGRERLRVSRLAMDVIGAGTDLSKDPAVVAVRAGKTWFGPVQFRKGTEPYMAIARPAGGDGGVTVADVNLKFVWDVVSRIKIGQNGLAYVVDATGTLIAHPDISLVLKKTDLKSLPQVAALERDDRSDLVPARDLAGKEVFAAHARIPALSWTVFVESPRAEALAPLYDSLFRLVLLLLGGLLLAAAESFFLARTLVRPLRALQEGAERIGAGELDQRIDVRSGDELEGLAERFNQMGAALQASYTQLERKVEERTRELSDALERQTATAEILRVISGSPTDVQPVLDTVAERSGALCHAEGSRVWLLQGDQLHAMTSYGSVYSDDARESVPLRRGSVVGRAFIERALVHVHDVLPLIDTEFPDVRELQARYGFRTVLAVPMLREGDSVGVITLLRKAVRAFSPAEIALVQAFADQAVIAIENVRLFNETKEALEQQTATSEVLQVISSSVADVQPVLDAVAERSRALCKAHGSRVWLVKGDQLRAMTGYSVSDASHVGRGEALPTRPTSVVGRAFVERNSVHIDDVATLDPSQYPDARLYQQRHGFRTALAVPMLRDGESIGVIAVLRNQVHPFSAAEIRLIETFADQAVIAIENVRLFNETKEALEQQTATAEVLRVISSSVADTAPVFEKILHSCSHLFESSEQGIVLVADDGRLHLGAHRGSARDKLDAIFPMAVGDEPVARAMAEQRVLHYPDVLRDAERGSLSRLVAERLGVGSYTQVFAPMRWEGQGVGYLYVIRSPVAPFADKEIGLLKTFADQAAIAIQNARLFHEIEDKSRQLEAANRHKSEFLANMSHELRTPLNAIIGFSEVLAEQMFGDVNDKQMEYLKDIHSSGQHLLALINDVLDLSKIEAGKMELDLSCFDLGLLLEHSATLVRERAQRHGLSLELDVGDGLGEWVADARKVKQIVVNLLSNAVKFTPNGGSVSVRARHLNGVDGRAGDWAEVSVTDTGVGIASEDQAMVFEEFRQAGGDVLRKAEGTGLGLALVKRFVELHGGAVTLDSAPGHGSTFRFTLPQREVTVLQ
jgi:signal transduction histidine kinase/putative methionine-R-sulfoxide reductase with GAF domain